MFFDFPPENAMRLCEREFRTIRTLKIGLVEVVKDENDRVAIVARYEDDIPSAALYVGTIKRGGVNWGFEADIYDDGRRLYAFVHDGWGLVPTHGIY